MPFKRIVVAVVGGTVLLIGLALLVLPGPAFLVIPIGLAILATEFVWARRWLRRAKGMATSKRKAQRTARAFRTTFTRRWHRLRHWLAAWWPRRPTPPPTTKAAVRTEAETELAPADGDLERETASPPKESSPEPLKSAPSSP
jgi:uncharacterized protein (TIGR02611 family)